MNDNTELEASFSKRLFDLSLSSPKVAFDETKGFGKVMDGAVAKTLEAVSAAYGIPEYMLLGKLPSEKESTARFAYERELTPAQEAGLAPMPGESQALFDFRKQREMEQAFYRQHDDHLEGCPPIYRQVFGRGTRQQGKSFQDIYDKIRAEAKARAKPAHAVNMSAKPLITIDELGLVPQDTLQELLKKYPPKEFFMSWDLATVEVPAPNHLIGTWNTPNTNPVGDRDEARVAKYERRVAKEAKQKRKAEKKAQRKQEKRTGNLLMTANNSVEVAMKPWGMGKY